MTNEEIDPLALLDSVFRGPSNDPLPHEETARLRRHMADLAAQHGISLLEKDIRLLDAEGSLSVEKREITVPTVSSELSYFVALHEIGHIVLQLPSFDERPDDERPHRLYRNEAIVWEWALDEALIAPSDDAVEKLPVFLQSNDPGEGRTEALQRLRERCIEAQTRGGEPGSTEE